MRKRNTFIKLIYSISISLLILTVIFGISNLFKVRNIETSAKSSDMIGFPAFGGRSIFSSFNKEVENHFFNNAQIKEVVVRKKYPDTLFIEVKYRERTAQIETLEGIYVVDSSGVIFEKLEKPTDLPLIRLADKKVDLGTNITQNNLLFSLKFLEQIDKNIVRIVDIVPKDDQIIEVKLQEGTLVVIKTDRKVEEIVSSLQMIMKQFTIEGKFISKIDFRFDKPVLSF